MNKRKPSRYIGEWFGSRVYPEPRLQDGDIDRFREHVCPFLSNLVEKRIKCVKSESSQGVCTITTNENNIQNWTNCPHRTLDLRLIKRVVNRLYGNQLDGDPLIVPLSYFDELSKIKYVEKCLASAVPVFLLWQEKLGGEINLRSDGNAPSFSFDGMFVEVVRVDTANGHIELGNFAVHEVQTSDFHGSFKHAVEALWSAVDLHEYDLNAALKDHPDWLGRSIQGPNISNIFKRTFYQLMLKFKLEASERCAGVGITIPRAVWQSWYPFLANISLKERRGVSVLEGSDPRNLRKSWIIVYDNDKNGGGEIEELSICDEILVDVDRFLNAALRDVPDHVMSCRMDSFLEQIRYKISGQIEKVMGAEVTIHWGERS